MTILQFRAPINNERAAQIYNYKEHQRFCIEHQRLESVDGFDISYLECGEGAPLVFLHGTFGSSFNWAKVLGELSERFRCLAPNMLGIGDSDYSKTDGSESYGFSDQKAFMDAFLDHCVSGSPDEKVILVCLGAGAVLGCDWAYRNSAKVRGIVHIGGAFFTAMNTSGYSDRTASIDDDFGEIFDLKGEMLEELMIRHCFDRALSAGELEWYLEPLQSEKASRANRVWGEQMPTESKGSDSYAQIVCYSNWLRNSALPKLMFAPSELLPIYSVFKEVAMSFKNQRVLEVEGRLLVQDTHTQMFIDELNRWADSI